MIYSEVFAEEELLALIEDTFDTCTTNREEIVWLICLLRGMLNVPNKRREYCAENIKINHCQYWMHPILEKYKKRWKSSNYGL